MFKIKQKSLIGLGIGFSLCILGMWLSFTFDLSAKSLLLGWFIIFSIIPIIIELVSSNYFSLEKNQSRIDKLKSQLRLIDSDFEKMKLINRKAKRIEFEIKDLRDLIRDTKLNNDSFWIDFFKKNIKNVTRFQTNYLDEFNARLNSNESKKELMYYIYENQIIR